MRPTRLLGLLGFVLALVTPVRAASVDSVADVLIKMPRFTFDTESVEERAVRMRAIAEASMLAVNRATCRGQWNTDTCVRVWPGSPKQLLAAMIALGFHESRYSQAVQEGRCAELPKGMQCDHGRARGLWQQWQVACPEMWQTEPGSGAELKAGAWCAARLLSSAYSMCSTEEGDTWAGAFGRYGARGCRWPGGKVRVATMQRVAQKI